MKKKNLFTAIVMTCISMTAQAQMYVCAKHSCDAFDHSQNIVTTFGDDSLWVGRIDYSINKIDSIVFRTPHCSSVQQLGWWGDVANGFSQYIVRGRNVDGINEEAYIVTFSFQAQDGICLSAHCEVYAPDSLGNDFDDFLFPHGDSATNDPYIYVKGTQTGVRKFEIWIMDGPVLPDHELWVKDGQILQADCSSLLAGRPMEEVQTIVEAWLHQKGRSIQKSQL